MKFSAYVGMRYLKSKKGNAFLSLITFFSIIGVGLGVATLIVTLSVMDGFEGALKSRLAEGEYHILVTRSGDAIDSFFPFTLDDSSRFFGAHEGISAVNPVLSTEAILRAKKRVGGINLRGVSESQINAISKQLVEAQPKLDSKNTLTSDGLWIGRELAFQLGILPGDKVQLISPTETEGPLEGVPRIRTYVVEAIYESGIPEKDLHVAYTTLENVRGFLRKPEVINSVEVRVKSFEESVEPARKLRQVLGESFLVKDWEQLNAHLFASLKLERVTMFIILTMIIMVASFNIVTSLKMNVIEKRKELSILQAMGAQPSQIGAIFLVQGGAIGVVGVGLGALLGIGLCLILKFTAFIELPDVFYDRRLPVSMHPWYIGGIGLTALVIVVIAAIYPAQAAAKMSPLEGIRNS